jgi:hypothetical protein
MRRVIGSKAGLLAVSAILLVAVCAGAFPLQHNPAAAPAAVTTPTKLAPAAAGVYNTITFTEAGLPATPPGLFWSVFIKEAINPQDGLAGYALGNNSPSTIVFTLNATDNNSASACNDCGNYTWTINSVPGYDIVSAIGGAGCGSTSASTGYCNITTASAAVAVVYHTSPQYTIQFNETGLATGTPWSVTFNGGTIVEDAPAVISFSAANGSYAYSVGLGGTQTGANQSTPASGTIVAPGYPCDGPNGGNLTGCTDGLSPFTTFQNISFEPSISVAVSYPVGSFSTNHLPYFAFPAATSAPYVVTWNVVVSGAVLSAANVSQSLSFVWLQAGCGPFTFPCPVIYTVAVPYYESAGGTATTGTFTFGVLAANLTASTYLGFNLPEGQWQIVETTTVINAASAPLGYGGVPLAGAIESGTGSTVQAAFIAITPPTGSFSAPGNNSAISPGIETIAGNYSGYFIDSANVTVYNASGDTVLTASVYAPLFTTNPFAVPWHVSVPGQYKLVLTMVAAWHLPIVVYEFANVSKVVSITYFNTSGLNIAGLGPGGSATLLILIGAIIGMIVMALVGRGLWGGSKPKAAEPWSPTTSSTTGTGGTSGGGTGSSGGMSDSGGGMSGGGMSGGGSTGGSTGGSNPPS